MKVTVWPFQIRTAVEFMQASQLISLSTYYFLLASGQEVTEPAEAVWYFNPVKLILLIGWLYLCLYCVQQVEFSPLVARNRKTTANIITLFTGPVLLAVLAIIDAIRKSLRGNRNIVEIIKEHIQSYSRITLFNSSGTELKQLYTEGETRSENQQIIRTAEQIIAEALDERASDITIEPKGRTHYAITFRLDGMPEEFDRLETALCRPVIDCLKTLSDMNILEKHDRQTGAFTAKTAERTVSFRVVCSGVPVGEKLSIRVLNQDITSFGLANTGLSRKQQAVIKNAMARSSGMLLICGPIGSGKTTTLYAMLNDIDRFTHNVVTLEDPVECLLPDINQIEINPRAGVTFANSLSNALRQDPSVVAIDEIRDRETATLALEAARKNQLVLSTIHSETTVSALLRLLDLGVPPVVLSSGLNLIISQRLIRQLCSNCKEPAELTKSQIDDFRRRKINYRNIYQAVGCEECRDTGYRGVTVIFDILIVDDKLRTSIANNTLPISQLRTAGDKKGRSNLQKQGLIKVVSGATSLEELSRVTV